MAPSVLRRPRLAVTTLLLAGAVGPPARAEPPAAGEAAHERARKQGEAAAARGDLAACVEAFERARAIAPDGRRAALDAGEAGLCEESRGRHVAAYDLLRFAQEQEPGPGGGGGTGPWKRFAEAVERLERRIARALVVVSPPEAEVFLDGVELGGDRSGRWVTLAPGEHAWTASAPGHEQARFTHTARGGDYPDVRLTLRPESPAARPCDEECRAALRAEGERIGREKAAAETASVVRKQVQAAIEVIYRRRVDPSLSLILGGALSAGLTLDVGPGFFLGGEARWRSFDQVGFSVGLEVQTLFPATAYRFDYGARLDITQIALAAVPCLQYKWFSGCAFGDVGMLIAGGVGNRFPDGAVVMTAGFGPRLGFQIPFAERFMVRGFGELRVSPINSGVDFTGPDAGKKWDNPLVSGLFGLGISFGGPVRRDP